MGKFPTFSATATATASASATAGFKLVGYNNFVRTNPRSDFFSVKRFHHVEFWCGDATNTSKRFSWGLGMPLVAKSDLSTGNSVHASYLLRAGNLQFLFTAPYSASISAPSSAAIPSFSASKHHSFTSTHGLAVRAIGIEVQDAFSAFSMAVSRGAKPISPPVVLGNNGVALAEVHLYGDVVLRLVSYSNSIETGPDCFLPGFEPVNHEMSYQELDYGIRRLDHAVGNVPELGPCVEYIKTFSGFHEFAEFTAEDVGTADSGLNSMVLANNDETVLLPLNEPIHGTKRKSQIQTYLEHNEGAGVQHLALVSEDIFRTLKEMRKRSGVGGFEFMPSPPPTYYKNLKSRVGDVLTDEQIKECEELGILADRDDQGTLLQIFTKPVADRLNVSSCLQVQRPEIEPIIYRDLFLFRTLASFLNGISLQKLGCNAELIVDEFGEKLLEELDYTLEALNIEDFYANFKDDPTVKIPWVYKQLSGSRVLVMEWIDGIRGTNPQAIKDAGIDVGGFLTVGVSAALRQLLEFGLFHGDPHPGNIFAMRDGRIAYVDFGNVAVLSQQNKQILIDAVVHAVNEDYAEMANDFTRLGFLASDTDVSPIVPALEAIWQNSVGKGLADFNFRSVTGKFNQLVYNYPIRIPERFSLVIRSLLTQEGICFTLKPDFKFLEVAYPYVAKRLLTDPNPALRERLIQVLFKDGVFQWKRLENLITLAKENVAKMSSNPALQGNNTRQRSRELRVVRKLDLTDTIKDGARLFLIDEGIRRKLLLALTEDSKLHVQELVDVYRLLEDQIDLPSVALQVARELPSVARDAILSWSASVLSDR